MFKERYDDFEKLHSKSSETFQKYKTEMDKVSIFTPVLYFFVCYVDIQKCWQIYKQYLKMYNCKNAL